MLKNILFYAVLGGWLFTSTSLAQANAPIAIAVHGGAGTMDPEKMTEAQTLAYKSALLNAAREARRILAWNGSALDAVTQAVIQLENSSLFNAGVGAVYTWDGIHELDASIMHGKDRAAGAIAGVTNVQNPILAARAVMERSPHVLLSGQGAEQFAKQAGLTLVPNSHFNTDRRLRALEKAKQRHKDESPEKWGTVGAVALDRNGNIAAATSTGGMTAKRWGRIGDSPIIGSGTFADNASCGVSATGHGEYFIRFNVAADICARVAYQNKSIHVAANEVLFDVLLPAGGTGGVIVVSPSGEIAMPFNTQGMYRAAIYPDGRETVAIFKEADSVN